MAVPEDVPLGRPAIRWDDLDETSSKYDRTVAAPSDEDLVKMWSYMSVILAISSAFVVIVFIAIASKKKMRQNPYNVYLMFLMIPDFVFSGFCLLTCALSAAVGHYFSPSMCRFQSWYLVFGLSANAWVNSLIAREIHVLLRSSQRMIRYQPPTIKQVAQRSLWAYAFCAFLGMWCIFSIDWIPLEVDTQFGFFCHPVEDDLGSTLFLWLVFLPCYVVIPYMYSIWVLYDIVWGSKLLPPRGRRRQLAVYFFRIIFVFLLMWTPSVVVIYILRGQTTPWMGWAFSVYSHLQGLVSASLSLLKPDVAQAVKDLLCCCCPGREALDIRKSWRKSGFGFPGRGVDSMQAKQTRLPESEISTIMVDGAAPPRTLLEEDDDGLPRQLNDFQYQDEHELEEETDEVKADNTDPVWNKRQTSVRFEDVEQVSFQESPLDEQKTDARATEEESTSGLGDDGE